MTDAVDPEPDARPEANLDRAADTEARPADDTTASSAPQTGGVLGDPTTPPQPLGDRRHRDPLVGLDLGGVRILGVLGEGGMGRVYVGEQISPARQVAVKVVQLGMATEATLRRFGQEAAIHSRLDHPAITQCFAVGTHESGLGPVPFAVMELVRGAKPITVHAREHSLPLDERLRLFKLACEGVAHGHARGVVHRDLKPGNILVGDDGHPKVIDFGIARGMEDELAAQTRVTRTGQLLGTLHFMAPEQFVDGKGTAVVDARTDVYALGVVLYELVSGVRPYELDGKLMHEASRIVREVEPRSLRSLDRSCPRAVSLIADRCLRKNPRDRYRDAGELAADIGRSLDGERLLYARPSVFGQLQRAVARQRPWALPAVAGLGLMAGLAWLRTGDAPVMLGLIGRRLTGDADNQQVFERVQAAVTAGQVGRTEVIGSVAYGNEYSDMALPGGILVGMRVSTAKFGKGYRYVAVGSIEPIYRTAAGLVSGQRHGQPIGDTTEFLAEEGYAVSGLVLHAPQRIEGFRILFSRIRDDGLGFDPTDGYASEKFLLVPEGAPRIDTDGKLVVGLWGWWAVTEMRGIGLYKLP